MKVNVVDQLLPVALLRLLVRLQDTLISITRFGQRRRKGHLFSLPSWFEWNKSKFILLLNFTSTYSIVPSSAIDWTPLQVMIVKVEIIYYRNRFGIRNGFGRKPLIATGLGISVTFVDRSMDWRIEFNCPEETSYGQLMPTRVKETLIRKWFDNNSIVDSTIN